MPTPDLVCDACGLPPHPPDAELHPERGLPAGWVHRTFGRRTFKLCDCCGSIQHFKGGVSAYLQETLGLAPNAVCDFSADAEPGSGLHRLRVRRPGSADEPPTEASA